MARAYSMDLRSRVIEAALSDGSIRQAARRFGVGITTATRWVRRWREQGESSARRQGKPRGSCLDPHRDDLLALVERTCDLTLAEIVAHLRAEHGLSARRYTQLQSPQVYTQKGFVENDDELGRGRNADRRPGR